MTCTVLETTQSDFVHWSAIVSIFELFNVEQLRSQHPEM